MAAFFPSKLKTDTKPQIQETQALKNKCQKNPTTGHISVKLQKIKNKNPERSQKNLPREEQRII